MNACKHEKLEVEPFKDMSMTVSGVNLPMYICKLCAAFYTDLDGIKKYEAQTTLVERLEDAGNE